EGLPKTNLSLLYQYCLRLESIIIIKGLSANINQQDPTQSQPFYQGFTAIPKNSYTVNVGS
ncbi:MAG: hypothetical protein ACI910_003248, partial [Oleispira sp.]